MLASVLLVACTTPTPNGNTGSSGFTTEGTYHPSYPFDPDSDLSPRHFDSEEEFASFVRSSQSGNGYGGYLQRGGIALDSAVGAPAPTKAVSESSESSSGGSDGDFSGTNNQVAGVDEGDILKTDGEYIYTVTGNTLFLIKAVPGESAEITATIDLEHQPQGLFIQGDRLAVFGSFWDQEYFKEHDLRPQSGMTYLRVYDVTDRQAPEMMEEYLIEGSYAQSRMIDGTMYFVITSYLDSRNPSLPIILRDGIAKSISAQSIAYYPMPYQNPQIATVHKVDINTLGDADSLALMVESMQTMYMSENALYIASAEYINEWQIRQEITMEMLKMRLTERDLAVIAKIEKADDDVLSLQEKQGKIFQVYSDFMMYSMTYEEQNDFNENVEKELTERMEEFEAQEYTVLHKIDISNDRFAVAETGKIPGRLNNQFALDEHGGYLRVATTISPRWWNRPMPMMEDAVASDEMIATSKIAMPQVNTESTNNVYVLSEEMDVVGSIKEIAKGESIYSTRFIGDRLYMVTFRQVDPFFVIDLSNPRNPRILGELKVPGFSRYLHPYDDNIVIGIGRDATDSGRQEGLKISLFDVSNVEKPREIAQWVSKEDNAQSSAEWEHKAFLFDREKELLVIPASSYDWRGSGNGVQQYNGAMVFHITEDDISLRGIVDHSFGTQNYGTLVERSLYIGDLLYTKSPNLLRINEIDDLRSVSRVALESKNSGPYPVY